MTRRGFLLAMVIAGVLRRHPRPARTGLYTAAYGGTY